MKWKLGLYLDPLACQDVFVGIVADAGEWTVDVGCVIVRDVLALS